MSNEEGIADLRSNLGIGRLTEAIMMLIGTIDSLALFVCACLGRVCGIWKIEYVGCEIRRLK